MLRLRTLLAALVLLPGLGLGPARAQQVGARPQTPARTPQSLAPAPANAAPAQGGQDVQGVAELATAAREALAAVVHTPDAPFARWDEVHDAAAAAHGELGPLVRAIQAIARGDGPAETRREAWRGLMHVQHRAGSLGAALAAADQALALRRTDELALRRAQLLDALCRTQDAAKAYEQLAASTKDESIATRARLRLALLRALGDARPGATARGSGAARTGAAPAVRAATPARTIAPARVAAAEPRAANEPTTATEREDENAPSALFTFAAAEGQSPEFRNRAALVLAMLGRPREAIRLYQTSGEGSALFRQEVRLAEWSLAAKAPQQAQRHAWNARAAATTRRDRNYALTLLTEAHRADGSIAALIDRFAAEPELDADSRRVWIDLLRETARVDEALALFRRSGEGGFTPEMRRELLAICRESGRDDELIRTYDEIIAAEPAQIEWRVGLSRYWLERGRRADAVAVWQSYVQKGTDAGRWLAAAEAVADLGLDDLALRYADQALRDAAEAHRDEGNTLRTRMFLFEFELRRGRVDRALEQLEAFDREADPASPHRVQLAEAFERIGNKKRACEVLTKIREVRGKENAEEDLEMRLAWLLSEVGDEEAALEHWRNLWGRVESRARRRQVEDRLMATASRLGVLGDMVVNLEEKLADGNASDRDAALLVRLYQKVGDAVSAAEIVEEYMTRGGVDPVRRLTEKANVYLAGKDYYHFEQTIAELIGIDPDNRADHLRRLAMSKLERGRPQEAREVLVALAKEESPADAAEFEAGVLTLASLHDEAARTYRKGLARNPERIDNWLLLANSMRSLGRTEQAIGMFQYLVEHADKDDLFTVAVDGILNMRARAPQIRWALRLVMERLAARHDKMYLYQLCADLYDELRDTNGKMRALEGSLPIAAEQRSQVLRELMDIAQGTVAGGYTLVNGVMVQQRAGGDEARRLAYGRRLIGLGDHVPPQVFLELGDAFLRAGEVTNAAKTFAMAKDVPDWAAFQRQVAEAFERAGYVSHALTVYERAMATQGVDESLLLKTGELNEMLGRDDRAAELYRQGIELLLARQAQSGATVDADAERNGNAIQRLYRSRNIGTFDKFFPSLRFGFMAVATPAQARDLFTSQRAAFEADLAAARGSGEPTENQRRRLGEFPRVRERAALLRELGLRFRFLDEAQEVDRALLAAFPGDESLLPAVCEQWTEHGHLQLAERLVAASGRGEDVQRRVLLRIGARPADTERSLTLADVSARLLPTLIEGNREQASRMLRGLLLGRTEPDDVPRLRLLLAGALYLDDDAAIVAVARHLVKATIQHARSTSEYYTIDAVLKRVRTALDEESFGLVVDAFLEAAAAKKDVMAAGSHVFLQLQRQLGRPLFTAAALRSQIEAALGTTPYVVSNLLELAPQEERLELLQQVWAKVPPTERPTLALAAVRSWQGPVPEPMAEFVLGAITEALDKLEPRRLLSTLGALQRRSDGDPRFVARVLQRVAEKHPADLQLTGMLAIAQHHAGEAEAAATKLRQALDLMAQVPENSDQRWMVADLTRRLTQAFVPSAKELLLAEVARLEAASARPQFVDDLRGAIFEAAGDDAGRLAWLERAVAHEPDSLERLRALHQEFARRGETQRAAAVAERLIAAGDRPDRWQATLRSTALAHRDAARALRFASEATATKAAKPASDATGDDARLPPATAEAVHDAAVGGRVEEAAATYRRLWRSYGGNATGMVVLRAPRAQLAGGGNASWPTGEERSPAAPVRRRGGLDDLRVAAEPRPEPSESKSLYEGIAEFDFGLVALRRHARLLDASQLPRSRELVRALQHAEVRAGGPAAVAGWREAVRNGRAGMLDRALLLSWFEDNLDALTQEDRDLLAQLTPAVQPLDVAQVRAFARLHAKLGDTARAARLYQWIASATTSSSRFVYDPGAGDARGLIPEIRKWLAGTDHLAAVQAILERSDPGGTPAERDDYVALLLDTWLELAGPAEAASRCKAHLEAVLDTSRGSMRRAAVPAARIFAASGDAERAVQALEVAVCAPARDGADDDAILLGYVPRRSSGNLSSRDVNELFPAARDEAQDAFVTRAATAVLAWRRDDRLAEPAAQLLLAQLALRLHEIGDSARAKELVAALEGIGGVRAQHLVVDLARLLVDETKARSIEDELLRSRALNVERVPEVVERVRQSEGAEKALAVGAEVVEWAPHPRLVDALIEIAGSLGRAGDVARFTKLRDDNLAAAKALDVTW